MATTTYEEEKKRQMPVYENAAPVGTYYGETGNPQSDAYQVIRQRYAEVADPQRQAEQDARIQRGRQFWTGANLFANVIANAINAHGTANDAPNMTYNDAATQKMYGVWQDADTRLKADRDRAAQRLDALDMQDAQMRAAGAEKRAAEAQRAADMNFKIATDNYNFERNQEAQKAAKEEERAYQDKVRAENQAFQREGWDRADRRARMSARGGGRSGSSSSSNGGISVSVGSVDIPAKDKNEAVKIRKDIANKIVEAKNKQIQEENKKRKVTEQIPLLEKPKNDKEAEQIIYQNDDIYDTDEALRNDINAAYGIEDPYAEEEEAAPQPKYQMPTYTPSWMAPAQQTSQATAQTATQPATQGVQGRNPYFEQFGGYSVQPENMVSQPIERKYPGSTEGNERAFKTDRTSKSKIPPYMRKQYMK